jgi:hypothetical protein
MMNTMLRSYKEIAEKIATVWGVPVSLASIHRWLTMIEDPLPVKRIKARVNGKRSIIVADPATVERWARRRVS